MFVMQLLKLIIAVQFIVSSFFCAICVFFIAFRNTQKYSSVTASLVVHKYSTRVVRTTYGPIRGVLIHSHPPVEAFLGIPYATPPVGSLRYMPPVTPSIWKNVKVADRFGAVCPQKLPDIHNKTKAYLEYPRNRLYYLERLLPLLSNQSEDCLYLNIYAPKIAFNDKQSDFLPSIVYIHGESYEWNSGNPYDGSVLASTGHILVITINFRLGILGFLKTSPIQSTQGNFGLMDLIAGLHWLRENLQAFGGDPEKVTLMGHGTGAALANFIAVSPVAKELLHRVIVLSGSGLSPWALQRDPLAVKQNVALQAGCNINLNDDDLAPCLRKKSLDQLLSMRLDTPRFLAGFAPFIDGTIVIKPNAIPSTSTNPTVATSLGHELADFPGRDLLFGLTNVESYLDFTLHDLKFGFNETRRDRILRTYVRNSFYYHLNEIFSTLKNEYTDWERPIQSPLTVRDATLDVLSDGHTAAPLIRIGYLHSMCGGKTFFLHFQHQSGEREFPMKSGSVHGEDLPYIFGLPLVGGGAFFPYNYSYVDVNISKLLIHYISNFAHSGDPNMSQPSKASSKEERSLQSKRNKDDTPYWEMYDTINQLYLELGHQVVMRNHYRGHKMSLWLNLIPQLHRNIDRDMVSMRHHHFMEEDDKYYDGSIRPQINIFPEYVPTTPEPTSLATSMLLPSSTIPITNITNTDKPTTDCPYNLTGHISNKSNEADLKNLVNGQYENYKIALIVTISIGCCLILLNIVVFVSIYRKRDYRINFNRNNKCDPSDTVTNCNTCEHDKCCGVLHSNYFPCDKPHENPFAELELQRYHSSPLSAQKKYRTNCSNIEEDQFLDDIDSTNIPEPPPPPKSHPPPFQSGILRSHGGFATTPRTIKKRVQIQEISV